MIKISRGLDGKPQFDADPLPKASKAQTPGNQHGNSFETVQATDALRRYKAIVKPAGPADDPLADLDQILGPTKRA